jgi:hypothetical protein
VFNSLANYGSCHGGNDVEITIILSQFFGTAGLLGAVKI